MKASTSFLLISVASAALSASAAEPDLSKLPPAATKQGVTYQKDIRPLFQASCIRCHGNDRPRGGLRLDSLESALKGGDDGDVIVPGKSVESKLVIAVSQIDDQSAMPPKRGPGGRGGGMGGFGPGGMLAGQMMTQGDKDGDKKLTKAEFTALADAWYDKVDPDKTGALTQEQFVAKFGEVLPAPQGGGPRGGGGGGGGGQRQGGGPVGPARFVGPSLFTATDTNKDGSLTREEFKGTFAKWFDQWDSEKSGTLTEEKLRTGLNAALPQPTFGGGGGVGGRGGPGGGGPGGQGGGPGGGGQRGGGQGGGGGGFGGPGGPGGGQGGGPGGGGRGGPGGGGGGGGFTPPKPLTPEQVGLVRAWIDQGAK
jgi:hypothetical protein